MNNIQEFLTTYGWAFLVILVMIGALAYFGVLNPENFMEEETHSITLGLDDYTCAEMDYGIKFNQDFVKEIKVSENELRTYTQLFSEKEIIEELMQRCVNQTKLKITTGVN